MIAHLLRHQLRHHRMLYLVAASLIFASPFLSTLPLGAVGAAWVVLAQLGIAAVTVRLLMYDHRWHDDRAFWRTRPMAPRTLFASQVLAFGLVVLLPYAAGLLLQVLPLSLGLQSSVLAIVVPVAVAVVFVTTLATCASLATGNRSLDLLPYFAAFVSPLLSFFIMGVVHMLSDGSGGVPRPVGDQNLSQFMCGLALAIVAASVALRFATLGHRWRPAAAILLLAGLAFPWVTTAVRIDFFSASTAARRTLGISIPSVQPDSGHRNRPRWTGLGDGEFFAPRWIGASWAENGRHHSWTWPEGVHPMFPDRLNSDLLRNRGMRSVLEDQHRPFIASNDVQAIWDSIRRQLPAHRTWRPADAPGHIDDPIDFGQGPEKPHFSLHARGDIYRLESLPPMSPVAPGRLDSDRPGSLEIRRVASDESQIAILLRQTIPDPVLGDPFYPAANRSTSPPEFWAVLSHRPSATAYACHGQRVRVSGHYPLPGAETRDHLLSFSLARLEIRLLGLDPNQLLVESELWLFHAVPLARGEVRSGAASSSDAEATESQSSGRGGTPGL